ncbi:MAG: hypothetical protein QM749_07395 [Aquabacterium sp.]
MAQVEVPVWRHARINLPHPLLKRGLVVLDTPGAECHRYRARVERSACCLRRMPRSSSSARTRV